jgi:hypothetical protein
MVESALKVAKNSFDEREMRFTRVMHVYTNLLDGIGDVRTGESGILKSASKATVEGRVRNRGAGCGG